MRKVSAPNVVQYITWRGVLRAGTINVGVDALRETDILSALQVWMGAGLGQTEWSNPLTWSLSATGAATLLAGDMGCLLNIAGRLKRAGSGVQVRHVAEVLAGIDAPAIGEPRR